MISYEISHEASRDFTDILLFFGQRSSRSRQLALKLDEELLHLREWPNTGHRRRDLTKRDVCFWTFDDYYLVFRLRLDMLSIVAILHTSRDVARILRQRLGKPHLLP